MATGHFAGILGLEGARGGVARIGEEGFLVIGPLLVELFKHLPWHQDLASDLELLGPVAGKELERNAADGLHVGRHVVALRAVAARHGPHHAAVAVGYGDGGAVEFHLSDNVELLAVESAAHAVEPVVDIFD